MTAYPSLHFFPSGTGSHYTFSGARNIKDVLFWLGAKVLDPVLPFKNDQIGISHADCTSLKKTCPIIHTPRNSNEFQSFANLSLHSNHNNKDMLWYHKETSEYQGVELQIDGGELIWYFEDFGDGQDFLNFLRREQYPYIYHIFFYFLDSNIYFKKCLKVFWRDYNQELGSLFFDGICTRRNSFHPF